MRALVTGCAGFIGSHLTESLLADDIDVLGIDCFNDNYGRAEKLENLRLAQSWDDFEFLPLDISHGELDNVVAECDVIFHLAAEPGVRPSWGSRFEKYLRNNVLATQHLLEALSREPGRRLVYASSSSVYGQAQRMPTPEDVTPRPYSPYGITKLSAEHLCGAYHDNHGVDTVVLRYFSVYGPRQRPDMAFRRFCDAVLTDRPLQVFGDGTQTRDVTFVGDVVTATRAAAEAAHASGLCLNIGGGAALSMIEAIELVQQIAGRSVELERLGPAPGEIKDTTADISLARSSLGYEPRTPVEEGLAAQWEWTVNRAARSGVA